MSDAGSRHDDVLDLIRGMAALLVVAGHLRALIFEPWDGGGTLQLAFYFVTALGHQAVIVFFVLSGYLVGGSAIFSMRRGSWNFRSYILRRYIRLSIVLLPALALTLILDYVGISTGVAESLYAGQSSGALINFDVSGRLAPDVLLGNIFFLQSIIVQTFGSNGALWSLAYEFWFYILFPAILYPLSIRNGRLLWPSLLALLGFVGLSGLQGAGYFGIWAMGALVAHLRGRPGLNSRGHASSKYILLAMTTFLGAITLSVKAAPSIWMDVCVAIAFSLLIHAAVDRPLPLHGLSRISTFFAKISYSLYATHLPLVVLVVGAATGGARQQFGMPALLLFASALLCAIAAGYLVWYLFERHTSVCQIRAEMILRQLK